MRLIDADALKEVIFSKTNGMEDLWDTAGVLNAINKAPTVEPPNQLVLRARDDAELEQLKEAWSKGMINFTPIIAYPDTPQGEWQQSPETEIICGIEVEAIFREWFCPFCKTEAFYDDCHGYVLSKFCPECGAKLSKRGDAK